MTGSRVLTLLCLLPLAVGATERLPIRDGEHAFRHRSAECPNLSCTRWLFPRCMAFVLLVGYRLGC